MPKSPAWFDLPMACLGAVVSGVIVAWINSEHGFLPALTAATKQAFYAFFATGLILQFYRWLALRPVAPLLAISMAVLIPLFLTMGLLYGMHSMKGTPEPLYSTIPGTLLSLMGLLLITWRTVRANTPAVPGQVRAQTPEPEHS
jgi:hypothetical protein